MKRTMKISKEKVIRKVVKRIRQATLKTYPTSLAVELKSKTVPQAIEYLKKYKQERNLDVSTFQKLLDSLFDVHNIKEKWTLKEKQDFKEAFAEYLHGKFL